MKRATVIRNSYLFEHPLLFVLALASTVSGFLFVFVPGVSDQSVAAALFDRPDVAEPFGFAWSVALLVGGLCVVYGICKVRPDVEAFGLVFLTAAFAIATIGEVMVDGSVRPLTTSVFVGLMLGHALRAFVIVRTFSEAQKLLRDP